MATNDSRGAENNDGAGLGTTLLGTSPDTTDQRRLCHVSSVRPCPNRLGHRGRGDRNAPLLPRIDIVDSVIGPYDLVATVGFSDLNGLADLVSGGMYQVHGVESTTTCLAPAVGPTGPWPMSKDGG